MNIATTWRRQTVSLVVVMLIAACGGQSDKDSLASAKERLGKKDLAGAVLDLKSALQKSPNHGEARFLLGSTLMRVGDSAGAVVELTKAAEAGYDEEAVQPRLAWAKLMAGRPVEVIKTTEKLELRNRNQQAELLAALSLAQSMQKQDEVARGTVEKALALDPASPAALSVKARYLAANGGYDEALSLLDRIPAAAAADRGEDHLLRAMIFRLGKKDLDAAERAYLAAATFPGQSLSARTALTLQYLTSGKRPQAIKQLEELRKSHPNEPARVYLEAVMAYTGKQYEQADGVAEQLLKIAPDSAQLLLLAGAISMNRGNWLQAETRLGKVVHVERHSRAARLLLSDTYVRMGQPERALGVLQPLATPGREDRAALPLLGQAHLALGHFDDAERYFAAASKATPEDFHVKTALAMMDLARGRTQEAFTALDQIAEQDKGDSADLALVGTRLKRREYDAALLAIDRLQKKQPNQPGPWQMRGVALRAKGDLQGARAAFEQALKVDPRYFASLAALVALDSEQGKLDAARTRVDAAVLAQPKDASVRMLQLDVLVQQHAPVAERLKLVESAIAASPDDARPRVAKVEHLLALKDVKSAALAAQDAVAALPNNPMIQDVAGQALWRAGDTQQAMAAFAKWASLAPKSTEPYVRMAELHSRKGDHQAAVAALVRGLDVSPQSPELQRQLLALASRSKDTPHLRAIGRDLRTRYPKLAIGPMVEGKAAVATKDWAAAITAYRDGLGREDPSGRNAPLLFDAYVAAGNPQEARKFLESWIAKYPRETGLPIHAAGVAVMKGERELAERLLKKVVEQEPQNATPINNLAWLMASRRAAGASDMAKRAVDLVPKAAPMWDTYAFALEAESKFEKAAEAQRKATQLMPDRVTYRIKLVKLLASAGKAAEAKIEFEALQKTGGPSLTKSDLDALRAVVK